MLNTKISINAQDIAVAEFLKANHINYSPIYIADMVRDQDWQHDLYYVTFTNQRSGVLSTEYKTGLGHRVAVTNNQSFTATSRMKTAYNKALKSVGIENGLTVTQKEFITSNGFKKARILEGGAYSVTPTSASVLYSLLNDARCGSDYDFEDFCSEFGYDEDSIKAYETYKACQKTSKQLKKVFSATQLAQLETLLEDY